MLFTQIEFLILLILTLTFLYIVKSHYFQKRFLLLVSYYFYSYWDWRFLGLILLSTVIDYLVGNLLNDIKSNRRRKFLVTISIISNLSILGFFKYFNFFLDSLSFIFPSIVNGNSTLNIILPVGISFYTFQSLSYTIDIYKKKIKPTRSFFDFALYVSFFPQLVAGPIIRARDFLPQLNTPRFLSLNRLSKGFKLFTIGIFKKSFIADNLAEFIDFGFANPSILNGFTLLIVSVCYAIQIYCDFSGYSDMAIGIACVMGYDFKSNFNYPYIAENIKEFWRRWHISLSSWLKDYLYISLGGNRKGSIRTYINLMITMLLGGLWHGASWNFIFWGLWHGIGLSVHRLLDSKIVLPKLFYQGFINIFRKSANIFFTLLFVNIGWIFFRSENFKTAFIFIERIFSFSPGYAFYNPFAISLAVLFILYHIILFNNISFKNIFNLKKDRYLTPIILFTMIFLIIAYQPDSYNPFIYFQF